MVELVTNQVNIDKILYRIRLPSPTTDSLDTAHETPALTITEISELDMRCFEVVF